MGAISTPSKKAHFALYSRYDKVENIRCRCFCRGAVACRRGLVQLETGERRCSAAFFVSPTVEYRTGRDGSRRR